MPTNQRRAAAKKRTSSDRRSRVSALQAREQLITTTIDLLRELPFDEVSVRVITDRADLNPSTVLRNFGTIDSLFAAVSQELLARSTGRLEDGKAETALFDPDVILRTKLLAWLLGRGVESSLLAPDPNNQMVKAMADRIQRESKVQARTAMAFNEILAYAAEGFVLFSEIHIADESLRSDGFQLIVQLQSMLAQAESDLGWAGKR